MSIDVKMLRDTRINDPEAIVAAASVRTRRSLGEKLMLVAADHPARGSIAARGRPTAMADRSDLLQRLVTALDRPGVDGVLGTADILEDLLLLGALDDRIAVASMNRGGLAGATFEYDDRFTAYTAAAIAGMGFDGGKMLVRFALEDPGTARTLEHSARAVDELVSHRLMAMVEPFMSGHVDGKATNFLTSEAVIKSIGIASALGSSSRYTWLKIPVVENMEEVIASTTLPTLLLGGDPKGSDDEVFESWRSALALDGVQGLVVGRSLLYPEDDDVAAAVDNAAGMVHG